MNRKLSLVILIATLGCAVSVDMGIEDGSVSSGGGDTTGGGTGSGGGTSTGGGTGAETSGGTTGTAGCTYPTGVLFDEDGGGIFPNATLGSGYLNLAGAPDDAAFGAQPDLLLQLHCSGKRYVLIDLSTAWDPHSQDFARQIPTGYAHAWLDAGGLVLTVLEQGGTYPDPASDPVVQSWAATYGTDYSLVNDPTQALSAAIQIWAWPALAIVDLSTMQVVDSVYGANSAFYDHYSALLGVGP